MICEESDRYCFIQILAWINESLPQKMKIFRCDVLYKRTYKFRQNLRSIKVSLSCVILGFSCWIKKITILSCHQRCHSGLVSDRRKWKDSAEQGDTLPGPETLIWFSVRRELLKRPFGLPGPAQILSWSDFRPKILGSVSEAEISPYSLILIPELHGLVFKKFSKTCSSV